MAHSAGDGQVFQTLETIKAAAAGRATPLVLGRSSDAEQAHLDLSGRHSASAVLSPVVPVIKETFYATEQVSGLD